MSNIIKATLYKIDGTSEAIDLLPKKRLKTLQKLVGGYIEIIQIRSYLKGLESYLTGNNIAENDLVINEEGLLLDLPVNPFSELVGRNSIWENQQFRGDIVLVEGRLP